MSSFLSYLDDCRVFVQGITGREASMVTKQMVAYGTNVVAGTSPGKGGQYFDNIPVYDSVHELLDQRAANCALVYVPPAFARDAVIEALENEIRLIIVATERVPQKDTINFVARANEANATIIGPNVTGLIIPRKKVKIGSIGGDRPDRMFSAGNAAIISRSGGMTSEIAWLLKREGVGVSLAVSIGGDPILGTTMSDVLRAVEQDPFTKVSILFCEPGGHMEAEVAHMVNQKEFAKPIIAFVAGRFTEELPRGTKFGHAGTIIKSEETFTSIKARMFDEVGIHVADRLFEIPKMAKSLL